MALEREGGHRPGRGERRWRTPRSRGWGGDHGEKEEGTGWAGKEGGGRTENIARQPCGLAQEHSSRAWGQRNPAPPPAPPPCLQ